MGNGEADLAELTPHNGRQAAGPERVTIYAWLVFALSFGLLISDLLKIDGKRGG